MTKVLGTFLAAAVGAAALGSLAGDPAAASAVESLYADLAGLPAEARAKRLVEGAAKEGPIVVAPNFRGKVGQRHLDLFKKRYPVVKLEALDMNTEAATERFIAEETAGRHLTDVLGVTTPDMNIILRRDLAARYPTPATAAVLPRYKGFLDAANRWLPWYWSEHGISYNPALLKEADAPKTYDDLCDPKFRGQVSYEPGETKWLIGMMLFYGEEKFKAWMDCVGRNEPVVMKGHTLRMALMFNGDHMIQGDNFLYSGVAENRRNPKKAPFAIVETAPVTVFAGVAVINTNTARPHASALWTDWQLSEECQQFVYEEFRGPLAIKHPFLGDSTELFIYGVVPEEANAKANAYWKQFMGVKR